MDHDDLLMSNCLTELEKAFQDPEVGFVYSSNAKLAKDIRRLAYNKWVTFDPEVKKIVTVRMVYKELKKEYNAEKRLDSKANPMMPIHEIYLKQLFEVQKLAQSALKKVT